MDRDSLPQDATPLTPLISAWEGRLRRAAEYRKKNFDCYAEEAIEFYVGPRDVDRFYDDRMVPRRGGFTDIEHGQGFRTVTPKVSELVQIFGPALYSRNPIRSVTTRDRYAIPREVFVPRALERQIGLQVQQIQQEAQKHLQQLQQQAPQQPGQPPNPQIQQMQQAIQQQVQQQIEQAQQPIKDADLNYQSYLDEESDAGVRRKVKAELLSSYLNYTPNELDLKTESLLAIDEALITGMGCLWQELKSNGSFDVVGSFFDTVFNLLIDPDVESQSDLRWISRRCIKTVEEVASRYGWDVEDLRPYAKLHSYCGPGGHEYGDGESSSSKEPERKTKDLITYYEIYSKIGFGQKIPELPEEIEDALSQFGEHIYLVLVPGMPEPLNFTYDMLEPLLDPGRGLDEEDEESEVEDGEETPALEDDLLMRTSWPIPFWMANEWPVEMLWYHEIPNCTWPMAHVRPAMGQLKQMSWNLNHLANRALNTSRFIVGIGKGIDDDNKSKLRSGQPFTVVECEQSQGEDIQKMMRVLEINQGGATELLNVQAMLEESFQKSTGLNELMYAQQGGMRSAAEAQMKQSSMNVRPDDMAARTEDWQSRCARKEALAAIWLLGEGDVSPVIGQRQGTLWEQLVASEDPAIVATELDVRIESGSTRKPNKETRQAQMTQAVQVLLPVLSQVALMPGGNPGPYNALLKEWGKSFDIADIDAFLLQPPAPQPPPPPDPNIAAKAQAEMQATQQEGQMKMALGQQEMQSEQQKLQVEAAKAQMELAAKAQELNLKAQEGQMRLQQAEMQGQIDIAKAQRDMQLSQMQHSQQMIATGQKAEIDVQIAQRKADAEIESQKDKAKQNEKRQQLRRQKRKQGRR